MTVHEQARVAAVFVHGFASKADTWSNFEKRITEDDDLKFVDVLRFEYATHIPKFLFWRPDRRLPTLSTIADVLQNFLDVQAADYQRLVLVCHSMGGLVAQRYLQRMLNQGLGADLARIRRVVMFATPNAGSEIAGKLRRKLLGSHPQERDLRPLSEEIRDTHAAVIRDIVNAAKAGDRTCPIPFSVYAGADDNIVPRASAQGSFPRAKALPGDHFSIIQPLERHHASFATLRQLLMEAASDSGPPAPSGVVTAAPTTIGTQPPPQSKPPTVIISELRADADGTLWEHIYHEVREELSSAAISVIDKQYYPDATVDLLITVRSSEATLSQEPSAKPAILKIYAEHLHSGGRILVGVCAMGEGCQDARRIIKGWLPTEPEGSFYIEGAADENELYRYLTIWMRSAIRRLSPQMQGASRIDRMLDLEPDPYDISGRNSL